MIPLRRHVKELARQRPIVDRVAARGDRKETGVTVAVPRRHDDRGAARRADRRRDRRERRVLLLRHQRPDPDDVRLLARRRRQVPAHLYWSKGILREDPFASIDTDGVGKLVKMAVERGRTTRPDLKLGICGEHGGDPASIALLRQGRPRLRQRARRTASRSPASRPRRPRWGERRIRPHDRNEEEGGQPRSGRPGRSHGAPSDADRSEKGDAHRQSRRWASAGVAQDSGILGPIRPS